MAEEKIEKKLREIIKKKDMHSRYLLEQIEKLEAQLSEIVDLLNITYSEGGEVFSIRFSEIENKLNADGGIHKRFDNFGKLLTGFQAQITELQTFCSTLHDMSEGHRIRSVKLARIVYNYIGAQHFGSINEFLNLGGEKTVEDISDDEKVSPQQTDSKHPKSKYLDRMRADIWEDLNKPSGIDSQLPKLNVPEKYQPYKNVSLDRNKPDPCNHVFTTQLSHWECGKCGYVKFYDICDHDFILESNVANSMRVKCLKCDQFFSLSESSIQLIKNFIDEKAKETQT